ncbi:hypothetical protein [Dyella acidiphila]|uniref:Uncharacterized protein n=1 Tax=Dyella acidiphila TaxID=2775866 RepID=A0ABR9GBS5_9GAMM|nr:hypothetical protein [Dyella acidiphila]MBE1161504.1 hypothetical protein [Dyella acidiphila]
MTKLRLIFGIWLLVWIFVLFIGADFYIGVMAHKEYGSTKYGQLVVYVLLPALLSAVDVVLIVGARKLGPWTILLAFLSQLVALPVFFFLVSGGI